MKASIKNKDLIHTLNGYADNTLIEHLGIEVLDFKNDRITARMPVDKRTMQPGNTLHGSASAAFAETIGSLGASIYIDTENKFCVGLEININHI